MQALDREVFLINLSEKIKSMSKLKALPSLAAGVMAELERRAGELTDRLNSVRSKGDSAFDKWGSELDAVDQVVLDAEAAINQLSNGGPPLDDSQKS